MKTVEMYYDFRSPFAYFASQRLALLEAENVEVIWKPVLVDVLLNLQAGREPTAEVLDPMCAPKRDHFMADIFRMIKYWKIDFAPPKPTPPSCNIAMAVASVMESSGVDHSVFGNAVFEAVWQKQIDVNDMSVLETILSDGNHDTQIIQVAKQDGMAELIKKSINAFESGVFGVPTFVWDNELFFGADRMELLAWSIGSK